MDLDFVGSPSSRRSSQFLLEVLDELEIIIQHLHTDSAERLFPSKIELLSTSIPASVPAPRPQSPKLFNDMDAHPA